MRLQRPALQQVHPVFALGREVAGEFYVHGIAVLALQQAHYPYHRVGEVRVFQQLAEVHYIRHRLAVKPQLAVARGGRHVRLHEKRHVRFQAGLVHLVYPHCGEAVLLKVDEVRVVL